MNIGLTEVYVNIKNYDFDVHGKYTMDLKEASKFLYAFNCQKEYEQELEDKYEQEVYRSAAYQEEIAGKIIKIADEIDSVIDTICEIGNGVSEQDIKNDGDKLMKLRDELYSIAKEKDEEEDGEEEKEKEE